MSQKERYKPGASFAFQPANNIASQRLPNFSQSGRKQDIIITESNSQSSAERSTDDDMVNERAPPSRSFNGPLGETEGNSQPARVRPMDDDDDISAIVNGWASLQGSDGGGGDSAKASFQEHSRVAQPGHPNKLVSSRKQKADVFIHQTSRPEHHRGGTRIEAPKPHVYVDRRIPGDPVPAFDSKKVSGPAQGRKYGEEVFYTDPAKASADLKALLEGGMEDEAEEEDKKEEVEEEKEEEEQSKPAETTPLDGTAGKTDAKKVARKTKRRISKDGRIDGLKVRLLPHQVEGVEWMLGRELGPVKRGTVPKGGLLADDMGLGKTLQTISLILSNQKPEHKDAEKGTSQDDNKIDKTTLVVAPLALIRQWEHEINDKVAKAAGLKVHVHHGPQRTKNYQDLTKYNVVITTYQILVSDHNNSSESDSGGKKVGCFGPKWWRVVLDEAHTIKNRNAKTTKACYALRSEYRWCLTGTPMQNNLDELQSLIRFLGIKPYDELRQWRDHIDQPLKNGKGHVAIVRLHSILKCFMKRRTKDILKEEGALQPGGKLAEGDQLDDDDDAGPGFKHTERKVVTVSAQLSAAERRFYDRLEDRTGESMKRMMAEKLNYLNAFTLLLRLRQACNHPKLVEGKIEKDRDAMTTDSGQSQGQSQKSQDGEVDAMTDLFSGMGIESPKCDICSMDLPKDDAAKGYSRCSDCQEDMAQFKQFKKGQTKKKKEKTKKSKAKKSKSKDNSKTSSSRSKKQATTAQTTRRPRNRNAIIDSEDEDDEEEQDQGSWLVSEGEQGPLTLGKAGGEEDENAAGPTEWLRSESEESEDEDQSNLSSFVVDDEEEEGGGGAEAPVQEADDSLVSVDGLAKKLQSQTLHDERPAASQASATGESESESESDSDDDESTSSGSGIDESELYSDDDEEVCSAPGSTQIVASAKIRELSRILDAEAREHKFIVFSQFTSMLDLLEPFLRRDGFRFTRYDGSMRNDEREESLRRLRSDSACRVLLCSLKCGSLGLNLTAATRVVIVEPFWNPFVEEQAIDRVHRLNQTIDVVVYKLTVADTVEERIIALQDRKRLLAEQAIDTGAKKGALKLGLSEIIDMFRPGGGSAFAGTSDAAESGSGSSARGFGTQQKQRGGLGGDKRGNRREESSVYGRRW